ncbi:prolyl 3-hydroxylase 1 isoform X2 [Vidua chalybeata]|uniref:prolyl 3-hydroxylase 1 isoform X2 n=1 Tax=Vidua chalybeata TaxID=81927 RepID=UPI0023A7FA66|nr:prolyl 3-hydroxylase 1 isoform X2 [Vidua chalybeata]
MALSPLPLLLLLLPALLMALLARAATPPEPVQVPVPTLAPGDPPLPAQSPDALFAAGAEAYARGDWPTVVLQMERALRARAAVRSRLVRCRLRCANAIAEPAEGTESQTDPVLRDLWFFRALLRRAACLRGCGPAAPSRYRLGEELDREFGRRSPYNYLQVAYFKMNRPAQAAAAAHTFFVANPGHQEMRQNLEYYQAMVGVHEDDFTDLEAKPHLSEFQLGIRFYTEEQPAAAILHLEKALEEYFVADTECRALCEGPYDYEGYNYLEYNADLFQAVTDHSMQVLSCKQGCVTELASQPGQEKPLEDFLPSHFNYLQFAYYNSGPLVYKGASVTMNSKALNGSQRVVVDGVLSAEECRELQRLANAAALAGDGYRGKTSPHTPSETFYGVTVLKALKLGQEGKVPLHSAYLYYNMTEKVRHMIESYFRLEVPLHFSYSHLVCRTAIDEKQEGRSDNSHEVHVDNCILNAEALLCMKEPPAYTFRDYSAILYLNGDFEGGAFYFTELDAKTETAEVQPQCGRAVGFSSGSENPHGVKAVTKGQRCAIALWFTLDPRHSERERVQADDLVKMLFGMEEGDLEPQPEKESPAAIVVGKDEL